MKFRDLLNEKWKETIKSEWKHDIDIFVEPSRKEIMEILSKEDPKYLKMLIVKNKLYAFSPQTEHRWVLGKLKFPVSMGLSLFWEHDDKTMSVYNSNLDDIKEKDISRIKGQVKKLFPFSSMIKTWQGGDENEI